MLKTTQIPLFQSPQRERSGKCLKNEFGLMTAQIKMGAEFVQTSRYVKQGIRERKNPVTTGITGFFGCGERI